jgi:hypothetical protein
MTKQRRQNLQVCSYKIYSKSKLATKRNYEDILVYHNSSTLSQAKLQRPNLQVKNVQANFTGKHLQVSKRTEKTGLYNKARYLDPKTSRWLSTDPALSEYIPGAPINDEAKKRNSNLPRMGGVFNTVNLHLYHYAGNNPVKYLDPNGLETKSHDDKKGFDRGVSEFKDSFGVSVKAGISFGVKYTLFGFLKINAEVDLGFMEVTQDKNGLVDMDTVGINITIDPLEMGEAGIKVEKSASESDDFF